MVAQEQIEEFFDLLREPYLDWVRTAAQGDRKAPLFDISKALTGTIFSYPGFEETAQHRDQSSVDDVVIRMLTDSIDGPTVLFDWGTYDGKRLHTILSNLPKEKQEQLVTIYGLDMNRSKLEQAISLFEDFPRPFKAIPRRIESLDFRLLSEFACEYDVSCKNNYLPVKPKKLTLALDNVAMNFNGLSFTHDAGITGFIHQTHDEGDMFIMQAHNVIDEKLYATAVEPMFINYLQATGLADILGGELFASYMPFGKTIHLEQMKEHVEFNGEHYHFPFGIGDADPAQITIGFSGCIPYERMYEFLVFNFANNLFVPAKQDIAYVGSDVVVRLKHFEHNKWMKLAQNESESFMFNEKKESGYVPYVALKELCPPFYLDFLYKPSVFSGMSPSALQELKRRNAYTNIRKVFPQISSERLRFDERDSWF